MQRGRLPFGDFAIILVIMGFAKRKEIKRLKPGELGLLMFLLYVQWRCGAVPVDLHTVASFLPDNPKNVAKYWPTVRKFFGAIDKEAMRNRWLENHRKEIQQIIRRGERRAKVHVA